MKASKVSKKVNKKAVPRTAHSHPPQEGMTCRKCGYANQGTPKTCNNCRGRFWWIQGRRHRPITGWVGRYKATPEAITLMKERTK